MKVKISAVCHKCGDTVEPAKDGDWDVYEELECECGGRYNLQIDRKP